MPLYVPRNLVKTVSKNVLTLTVMFLTVLHSALLYAQVAATMPQPRPPIALPRVVVPDARFPIEIQKFVARVEIIGSVAKTHIELELKNPNERVLEGELQFPLRPGQSITGFALDIGGELREAVAVPKAVARQVFDDVTRTRVDPALLEVTAGNNYKLRVYPLPARGTRRVVLELSQVLSTQVISTQVKSTQVKSTQVKSTPAMSTPATSAAPSRKGNTKQLSYQLPLQFEGSVAQVDVEIRIPSAAPNRIKAQLRTELLPILQGVDQQATIRLSKRDYKGSGLLNVTISRPDDVPFIGTQLLGDQRYFYAELPIPFSKKERQNPATLGIIWDASGSGAARQRDKEFALLAQYFKAIKSTQVSLVVVRDVAQPVQQFSIVGGDWSALRLALERTVYDGATNLGLMVAPKSAAGLDTDLALLFTDGLGNYGNQSVPKASNPMYAIVSSVSQQIDSLQSISNASGGGLIDLLSVSPAQGVAQLQSIPSRLHAIRSDAAGDFVSDSSQLQEGVLKIAGRLNQPSAAVDIEVIPAVGPMLRKRIVIAATPTGAANPTAAVDPRAASGRASNAAIAANRWAEMSYANLGLDREKNRAAMMRISREFNLVTADTSLIVLDGVADYARYSIEPPAALRAEYMRLVQLRSRSEAADQAQHLQKLIKRFELKQAWWNTEFPKDIPPPPRPAVAVPPPAPRPAPTGSAPPPIASPAAPASAVAARAQNADSAKQADGQGANNPSLSIALKKWSPDSPYIKRLRAAATQDLYAIYLDERPSYTNSTAFFLDVADLFFERGQQELALRILSNLAEMQLESRHILRILSYRLLQANQIPQAIAFLEKVLVISPDEPQSYRDLGLALARNGQDQRAMDHFIEVVLKPWNNRFPDIEMIALADLNALNARSVAAGKPALSLGALDTRLVKNLPLDIRAVLTWDADNTDVDLWVIDPNGERAFYGRQLTYQGGRMSLDFTGGYGPEEFSLRNAKPGTYTVKAQFYGHNQQVVAPATTIMLRLSTGFGTTTQKDEDITLRLNGRASEVTVGTFEVAKP